ncbi:MAG TPA: hypothetical protein VLF93_01660 [Candidatus Saccharimonadales bacterium]|nr:hypothetical protein [Candidatus Saccharimonadales bacterium]
MVGVKEFGLINAREYPFFTVDRDLRRPYRIPQHITYTGDDYNIKYASIEDATYSRLSKHVASSRVKGSRQKIISPPLREPNVPFIAIVGMPVKVGVEPSGNVEQAVLSLVDAAAQVDHPVVLVSYLNDTVRSRRNQLAEIALFDARSQQQARDIAEMIPSGSNLLLQTATEHELPNTTWLQRRDAMFGVGLSVLDMYIKYVPSGNYNSSGIPGKWIIMHNTPYLQVDADTKVSSNAIKTVGKVLGEDEAIFVNGTLHYTGGVMELSPVEVARGDTNSRLLYFAEILRRRMLDTLPPISMRGYLSEFGSATQSGVLATLGGYKELDEQNESWYTQIAAMEARAFQLGQIRKDEMQYPEAYIDPVIGRRVNGLVYYAPREEYAVDSLIRGIDANMKRFGRNALVDYDQGKKYITWTDFVTSDSQSVSEPEPTLDELLTLINSVYSSFKDRGGKYPEEDDHESQDATTLLNNNMPVEKMNLRELLRVLFPTIQNEKLVFWEHTYIPEDKRSKVVAA